MNKAKKIVRLVLVGAYALTFIFAYSGIILDGYYSLVTSVFSVILGIVAILLTTFGLLAKFSPIKLAKIWNRLIGQVALPDSKAANKTSSDWSQWFEQQNRDGWRITFDNHNHKTPWSDDVSKGDAPLPEYPRPQLKRKRWLNLNGLWAFNVLPKYKDVNKDFPGQVLVPFPIESYLSGIARPIFGGEKMWYRRTFQIPSDWKGERVVLNFGAVDWHAKVYINGQFQVEHIGGYTPFSADITKAVDFNGINEIVVSVYDPTDSNEKVDEARQKGKQTLEPGGISYTSSSGIWQTVWLEPVSASRFERVNTTSNIMAGCVVIEADVVGKTSGLNTRITKLCSGEEFIGPANTPITVLTQNRKLWTPQTPYLYEIRVELLDGDEVIDSVDSYFALRELGKERINGEVMLTLNGNPMFHHGLLDQGFWPDGLYTHASDKAIEFDVQAIKSMGFNMVRKHLKVESARWYYHTDRLGLMVWQDMPSAGSFTAGSYSMWLDYIQHLAPFGAKHVVVRDNDYHGWKRTENSKTQYFRELSEMMNMLCVNPSVVCWVPFNENWGQFDAIAVTDFVKNRDTTRLINNVSGEQDQGVGDIYDCHIYMQDLWLPIDPSTFRASVIGEYGGKTWQVKAQTWCEGGNEFSYGKTDSIEDFRQQYKNLMINEVKPLIFRGLAAAVYTQFSDIEGEINGLITYNRQEMKVIPETMLETHEQLYKMFEDRLK